MLSLDSFIPLFISLTFLWGLRKQRQWLAWPLVLMIYLITVYISIAMPSLTYLQKYGSQNARYIADQLAERRQIAFWHFFFDIPIFVITNWYFRKDNNRT